MKVKLIHNQKLEVKSMSIYTRSKTTAGNLEKAEDFEINDNSFKVGIKSGAENIIIDYLTNLYSNPATAVCRELFTNASDASDDDLPVYIEINAEEVEERQAKTYSFSIIDYGCGMSVDELKNNYITYANSSKVDDYDAVGSFGLGSKSPMAIVPKYTVESFNGKEQNIATVARTNNGIFANIEKVDEVSDHSFTRVSFGGISCDTAKKMHLYIRENICRFSKQPVHFKSCFKDEVEFLECYSISDNVSMYSSNIKEALIKYSCDDGDVRNRFRILARVNNIVYKVNHSYLNDSNDYIVVDVEPGYFSFAPSREELPFGKEQDHIIDIVNNKPFNSQYDLVMNLTKNGVFECDDIFNYLFFRGLLKDIDNFDCFYGATKNQLKLYKDIVDIDNGNYNLDKNNIKFYTIRSKETNKYCFKLLDDRKLVQVGFNEFIKRLKDSVGLTPYTDKNGKFSVKLKDKWHLNRVTIVKNSKFTRKNEVIIPSEYKTLNARSAVKDEFIKICSRSSSYNLNKFGWYFVYLNGKTKLPKSVFEYINKFCFRLNPDKDSEIHYIENSAEIVEYSNKNEAKSTTTINVTPVNERKDYFEFFNNCETNGIRTNYGNDQLVKTLKDGYKYFVYESDGLTTSFLRLFTELYETGLIRIHDKTKMVKKYLNSLGLQELIINDYTIEKIKEDVKEKFVDGEYVASFIHYYSYKDNKRAEFSCIRSDLDITNYPSTHLAVILNNDVCGCKSIAEFFNVDKRVCKSAIKTCAGINKFGGTSIASNNYATNKAVFSLLEKNINKKKAWSSYGEALTKLAIYKKYNSTIRGLRLFLNKNVELSSVEPIKGEELLNDILAKRINEEMSNIGFDKLDNAVKEFHKFNKYISIYSLLDNNDEVDSFVKSKMDEKADVIVEEFNKLDI